MKFSKIGFFMLPAFFAALLWGGAVSAGPPEPPAAKYLEVDKEPFHIKYPQGENLLEISTILQKAQKRMESRYGYVPPEPVPIIIYATTKEFQAATDKPKWMAALARKDGLHFQPTRVLRAKGSLEVVMSHEYTHWVQNYLTAYNCPHWLAEGLAVLESGEGATMEKEFAKEKSKHLPSLKQMEQDIMTSQDQKKVRLAYFRAYQFSSYLEHKFGIKKVAQLQRTMGEGKDINTASTEVFGQSMEELVEKWRKGA